MSQMSSNDPLAVVRKMWGNMGFGLPGIVVPTFDVDELEKRITDLKAVEGWLNMNLSMLQMTIRNLEMQKNTIKAVQAVSEMASNAASSAAQATTDSLNALSEGGASAPSPATSAGEGVSGEQGPLWPWAMMQQVQEYMQRQAESTATTNEASTKPEEKPPAGSKKSRK